MDTPKDASSKDALARAVDHCASGEWQQAHEIVQKDDSMLAAWIHGVVHLLEGDLVNAQGWYRKTDRAYPGPEAVQAEIAAARRAVHGACRIGGQEARPIPVRGARSDLAELR